MERQQFHFSDALPDTGQKVRVEVLEGRGYVHVIDQPSVENHYTLAVAIEDRQPGSAFYSIALYWDTSNNGFDRSAAEDRQCYVERAAWTMRLSSVATNKSCVSTCGARRRAARAGGGRAFQVFEALAGSRYRGPAGRSGRPRRDPVDRAAARAATTTPRGFRFAIPEPARATTRSLWCGIARATRNPDRFPSRLDAAFSGAVRWTAACE